jgi:hypothetical protein
MNAAGTLANRSTLYCGSEKFWLEFSDYRKLIKMTTTNSSIPTTTAIDVTEICASDFYKQNHMTTMSATKIAMVLTIHWSYCWKVFFAISPNMMKYEMQGPANAKINKVFTMTPPLFLKCKEAISANELVSVYKVTVCIMKIETVASTAYPTKIVKPR